MRLGVWALADILRSLRNENGSKTDPSHKPFGTPPGFCADPTCREQSLGRVLPVLGWVSAFWWHHFPHSEEVVLPRSFTLVLSIRAEVNERITDSEEAPHRLRVVLCSMPRTLKNGRFIIRGVEKSRQHRHWASPHVFSAW